MLTRRQEYADATRNAVLHAAESLLVGQDGREVSIDEVAAAARVSKGTVYHHFADKSALFEAVYRRQLTWAAAALEAAASKHGDPWRQLWALAQAYLEAEAGESRDGRALRAAPELIGVERARRLEEELLAPSFRQVLDRLSASRQLVAGDPAVLVSLTLGLLREGALVAAAGRADGETTHRSQVLKGVQAMLRGLDRSRG